MTFIRLSNVSKQFTPTGKHVLKNITLEIQKGESFVVIGGSGTGKSVLIKCIMGLMFPSSGQIYFKDQRIEEEPINKRQSLINFGMLFQGGALFDSLSVKDNIAFGLIHGKKMNKDEAYHIALEKLESVELDHAVMDLYPHELSGGMQKRVALARAIATRPELIFFDEPTTGLDPIVSGKINVLINKLVKELGAAAITITHDMSSVRHIADRIGLLYGGEFIWMGQKQDLDTTDNPYVQQFIHGSPIGPF